MNRGFGDYIRSQRLKKGITQKEFAIRTNLSTSEICKIENGSRSKTSIKALKAMAPVLGVTLQDLLYRAGYIDDIAEDQELTQKNYVDSMGNTIKMTYLIDSIYRADVDLLPLLKTITDRMEKKDIGIIKGLLKTLSMDSVAVDEKNALLVILSKFLRT